MRGPGFVSWPRSQFFLPKQHQTVRDTLLTLLTLIEDAKFYQDVAINYQNTYEVLLVQQAELQDKFKAQSCLMEEASAAIHAAETEAQQ